jgi:hypothetical protein
VSTDPISRYIAATRLTSNPGPVSRAEARQHAEALDDVTSRLEFIVPPTPPRLYVTSPANAIVETLAVEDRDVIVYDTSLGRAFTDLSDFASADSPPDIVVRWGLKHLAITLASIGSSESRVFYGCSLTWNLCGQTANYLDGR